MTEVPNDNHHDATNDQGSERQPGNGPLRDDPTLGDFSVDPVRGTEADSGIGGGDALSGAAFSDPHEETADDTGREDSPETTERGTAAGRAVVGHETAMSNEGNRTDSGNPLDNQGKEETDTAADNGEADASPTQHDQAAETAGAVVVGRETGGEEIPRRTVLAEGATSPSRFGVRYQGGGEAEYNALTRLYEVDPEHVAQPIGLLESEGTVIGYEREDVRGVTLFESWLLDGLIPEATANQVYVTLDRFHAHGIAHGDPNATNIIMGLDGNVKFTDPVGYGTEVQQDPEKYIADDQARIGWLATATRQAPPSWVADTYRRTREGE